MGPIFTLEMSVEHVGAFRQPESALLVKPGRGNVGDLRPDAQQPDLADALPNELLHQGLTRAPSLEALSDPDEVDYLARLARYLCREDGKEAGRLALHFDYQEPVTPAPVQIAIDPLALD